MTISPDKVKQPTPAVIPDHAPLSPSEERTWAMLAHLCVVVNLVTGFLGPIAALVIFLIFKDRSRYVAYQSLQSLVLQLICWVGGGAIIGGIWAITGILSAILVGLLLIPVAIMVSIIFGILPIIAVVYGVIAAIQCDEGKDFRYWLIGDWVRGTYEN
jgi:uncharacterized protein